MGSSRANSWKSRGFSLVELVVVVAILGIVATLAVPTTQGIDESRVDEAASEVAQALRFARDLSIATGDVYGVELNKTAERVRVLRFDTSVTPAAEVFDVRHPISKRLWDIDFDDYGPARGVNLEVARNYVSPCTTPLSFIRFTAGEVFKCEIPISARLDHVTVTLSRESASAVVLLDGLTGRVSIP